MGHAPLADDNARKAAEHAARTSRARLIGILAGAHGDLALAEDAVADAFARALTRWPVDGVPRNPDAWLLTVARNVQRDTWKSSAHRTAAPLEAATDIGADAVNPLDDIDPDAIPDRRLALLFACAHPAIDPVVRAPLMLQTVLGFEAAAIAAALALPTATLTKRLVRAKRRIRDARLPFTVPDRNAMGERLPAVLEAIYGCFAIAWSDTDGRSPEAGDSMAGEARYLAITLASLLDDEPEAWGLAALISFSLSRAKSRSGPYVPLEEQDPATWDADLIAEAEAMLRRASAQGPLGRFQLEAAMQAVHADRRRTGRTDWPALERLVAALVHIAPTLGARIAQAAIVGRTSGAEAAVTLLDALQGEHPEVVRMQAFHATRADALLRAGRSSEARQAFRAAIDLSADDRVRDWLRDRARAAGGADAGNLNRDCRKP